MPTYDYECDACGHQFEEFQSMRDDALTVCPSCNETALRRLITGGTGVIFKGSGFYVTDSKKKSASSEAAKPSDKTGGSDGKPDEGTSSDAKSSDGSGGPSGADGSSGGESASSDTTNGKGKSSPSGEKKTA